MDRVKSFFVALALLLSATAVAQYSQLGPKNEFMLKVEAGYSPFMGNTGTPGADGYRLAHNENFAGLNVLAGVNLSQDWFVGGGVGGGMYLGSTAEGLQTTLGAHAMADLDFRPTALTIQGGGNQPSSVTFAPMVGGRVGASVMMADEMLLSPLVECYGGINWFYAHGLRNMSHNWHSLYATIGVAYMQKTVFLPLRLGWRW